VVVKVEEMAVVGETVAEEVMLDQEMVLDQKMVAEVMLDQEMVAQALHQSQNK
jgi:hypothetical protein